MKSNPQESNVDSGLSHVTNSGERVSVVIPAYNASEHLGLAICSVLEQTRKVDEIIVIDDGSTDETRDVVLRYANQGVRYEWQKNQGSASARNRGVRLTSGDFIAFLDADDYWLPEKIERQLTMFKTSPALVLVSGDRIFWDVDRSLKRKQIFSNNTKLKNYQTEIVFENVVGNPSMVMIKRTVLDQSGLFDPALRFGDDWDMWIRVLALGEIAFVPEPITVYRWHKKSLSQSHKKACLASYRKICRRGINQTIPPLMRPLAFTKLVKHSEALYNYRALRGRLASGMRRLLRRSDANEKVTS